MTRFFTPKFFFQGKFDVLSSLPNRDTISGHEKFLKMVDRVTFCPNVTRFLRFQIFDRYKTKS